MAGHKHGPNRITNYFETHDAIMGQFVDGGFILADTLEIVPIGAGYIAILGSVSCLGEIELDVWKILEVVDGHGSTARVQTIAYAYNAHLRGIGNIFRYDSPHPDHNRYHHVHKFEVFGDDHEGRVEEIDAAEWPTLGDVLSELQSWFYENYERLDPDN